MCRCCCFPSNYLVKDETKFGLPWVPLGRWWPTTHHSALVHRCTLDNFDHAGSAVATRVSQEFFQTMGTPKLFAFGYVKTKLIEKIKFKKNLGNFFWLFQKWKFHGAVQSTYVCSGKRNERVCWRNLIRNPLGSLVKVSRRNYCSSEGRFSDVAGKQ